MLQIKDLCVDIPLEDSIKLAAKLKNNNNVDIQICKQIQPLCHANRGIKIHI
jgi:hypothetical protein